MVPSSDSKAYPIVKDIVEKNNSGYLTETVGKNLRGYFVFSLVTKNAEYSCLCFERPLRAGPVSGHIKQVVSQWWSNNMGLK